MKNHTHFYLILFPGTPVKIISLKPQLSIIASNMTSRNPGMISAPLNAEGAEI
jgi:hypothetical protein